MDTYRQIVTIMDLTSGAQNNLLNFIRDNKVLCYTSLCMDVYMYKQEENYNHRRRRQHMVKNDKILQLFFNVVLKHERVCVLV